MCFDRGNTTNTVQCYPFRFCRWKARYLSIVWLKHFVFVIISLMMVTINLHWSLVLLIVFTAFALLLIIIVLLKLGQDTKYDIYYSRDGLAYKIIDLWYRSASGHDACWYIKGKRKNWYATKRQKNTITSIHIFDHFMFSYSYLIFPYCFVLQRIRTGTYSSKDPNRLFDCLINSSHHVRS